MRISDTIERLEAIKEKHGDIPVVKMSMGYFDCLGIGDGSVYIRGCENEHSWEDFSDEETPKYGEKFLWL